MEGEVRLSRIAAATAVENSEAAAATSSASGIAPRSVWSIPDPRQLQQLPATTTAEIRELAVRRIRLLFSPRLLLHRHFAGIRVLTAGRMPSETPTLASPSRLRDALPWLVGAPEELLFKLQARFTKRTFRHREVIAYGRTPWFAMSIVVVLEGTVDVAGKRVLQAPVTLNDALVLDRAPAEATVTAVGFVDTLVLGATALWDVFGREGGSGSSSSGLAARVASAERAATLYALARRQEKLADTVLGLQLLSHSILFRAWPADDQVAVISKFTPVCMRKGETTAALRRHVLLVHSGRCIPVPPTVSEHGPTDAAGAAPLAAGPGTFLGEVDAMLGLQHPVVYVADYNTSIFALHFRELKKMLSKPSLNEAARAGVRQMLEERLLSGAAAQHVLHSSFLRCIPFLSSHLNPREFEKIAQCVQPRVYFPQEVMCSTSEFCNEIIAVVRGKAMIRCEPPTVVATGEPIGYTLLAQHKWRYLVAAEGLVEAFVLTREALEFFFSEALAGKARAKAVAQRMARDTAILMKPAKFNAHDFARVRGEIAPLTTLPLFDNEKPPATIVVPFREGAPEGQRGRSSSSFAEQRHRSRRASPRLGDDIVGDSAGAASAGTTVEAARSAAESGGSGGGNISELVKRLVAPHRPLPARTAAGKSDVFYARTTRSCTLAFHSKLLRPSAPQTPRGADRPQAAPASAIMTRTSISAGHVGDGPRTPRTPRYVAAQQQQQQVGGGVGGGGGGGMPRMERRGRLYFAPREVTPFDRVEQLVQAHRQRVDSAWLRAPRKTRGIVSRLYPPQSIGRSSSDHRLSRAFSFTSRRSSTASLSIGGTGPPSAVGGYPEFESSASFVLQHSTEKDEAGTVVAGISAAAQTPPAASRAAPRHSSAFGVEVDISVPKPKEAPEWAAVGAD